METVIDTIKEEGPLDAPISVAEVHNAGKLDGTRTFIKFAKSSTLKASQMRTAARNRWSPLDANGRPTQTLTDDELREVKVTMFLPGWMKEYIQPLKDVTEMYCAQHSVDWSEVRVDTKRQLVTHGDDVLAVLRFDGSCVLTPFIMNKQVA